ncbi:ribonuclease 2-5A-domain-containing protein [Gloeopeniophorella convolvens]|nr:ribonuclease 2-5A-domain-containing protein [Gloeopeniophorella convolvens]
MSRPLFLFISLLLFAVVIANALAESLALRRDVAALDNSIDDLHFFPPPGHATPDEDPLELLNVVLVASVDGKFHALNRTTGGKLWSMPATPPPAARDPAQPVPAILEPLVSTQHLDPDPDADYPHETYIVEPQSGDIYVTTSRTPSAPLQRLPFSMAQLTSLLLIELETGRCPWDAWGDFAHHDPSKQFPTEIFIGRTDYHVSIHTRPSPPSSRPPPVQHLSFSTYGPNNQDLERQAAYRRSIDDLYLEPLPNGEVISFRIRGDIDAAAAVPGSKALWGQAFANPVVAVFDVVKSARRTAPFVLLQPRPRRQDILPDAPHQHDYAADDSAFVGLVPDTGSLFALSLAHYPLVTFGEPAPARVERIDGGEADGVVVVSHDDGEDARGRCFDDDAADRRCLTGLRALRVDSASRLARLLDGVQGPAAGPPTPSQSSSTNSQAYAAEQFAVLGPDGLRMLPWQVPPLTVGRTSWAASSSAMLLATVASVGMLLFWFRKKAPVSPPATPPRSGSAPAPAVGEAVLDKEAVLGPAVVPVEVANGAPVAVPPVVESTPEDLPKVTPPIPAPPASSEPPNTPVIDAPDTPSDPSAEASSPKPESSEDAGEVKKKHRKRRRKRKGGAGGGEAEGADEPEDEEAEGAADGFAVVPPTPSLIIQSTPTPTPSASASSLVVSDTVLGYGSHGTVVYQGSLQGRAVAVKRLLNDFVTLAAREVSLLKDADDHPNRPDQFREVAIAFAPKRALRQVAAGLRHLHALKIVHRDIKPQNILVSAARPGEAHRMLISDFGLCRRLELDQTSFLPTAGGAMGVGTVGWRAPEILRGEVKLDELAADDGDGSSRGSVASAHSGSTAGTGGRPTTRLTKSVDIFALGCLFYYCLTNGGHPFGERFEREVNIVRGQMALGGLEGFGEEGSEAVDLISQMLAPEAADRPDTTTCLMHPYFWEPGRRLGFLQDASDRFEIMCREPRDAHLVLLERGAAQVVGADWAARLDRVFVENLGKFRKYDGRSVQDLLRALRNKKHHYQDLPEHVRRHVGSMPEGYLAYFTRRFPRLFLHVHGVIASSSLRHESMFRSYFDLAD